MQIIFRLILHIFVIYNFSNSDKLQNLQNCVTSFQIKMFLKALANQHIKRDAFRLTLAHIYTIKVLMRRCYFNPFKGKVDYTIADTDRQCSGINETVLEETATSSSDVRILMVKRCR